MGRGAKIAALFILALTAAALNGCVTHPDTSPAVSRKAQPYARTWADPSWPRPDQPPDRDGRSKID